MSCLRESLRVALLAASIACASSAGVVVVDPQGNPGYPLFVAAVSAAADGDTILLKAGNYFASTYVAATQVVGKGLTIVNDAGAPVQLSAIAVSGLPAGSTFALRGLKVFGNGTVYPALAASQCSGTIWIEDCTVTGGTGDWSIFPPALPGSAAIALNQVAGLVVTRSTVVGGKGGFEPASKWCAEGGVGCDVQSASVAIYASSIRGGDSGEYQSGNGTGTPDAGDCLVAGSGSNVLIAGSTLKGGNNLEVGWLSMFFPGSGLIVDSATVRLRDTSVAAGSAVTGLTVPAIVDPNGGVSTSATKARWIEISSPMRSGQLATYKVHGLVNDPVLVIIGSPAAPMPHVGYEGSFVFALGAFIGPVAFGSVPAGGVLTGTALAPPLPPSIDGVTLVLQAAIASTATLESGTLYVQVGPNF